eukprot:scaffold8071_cov116-Isochrysis_galbana.AAC.4
MSAATSILGFHLPARDGVGEGCSADTARHARREARSVGGAAATHKRPGLLGASWRVQRPGGRRAAGAACRCQRRAQTGCTVPGGGGSRAGAARLRAGATAAHASR